MISNLKKFLPLIAALIGFLALMVAQMALHGTSSNASKLSSSNEKTQVFENEFSKLKLKSFQGNNYDFSGETKPIVIINFWASWCRPCLSEFKSLNEFVAKFGDRALVLGINSDTEDPIKAIKKTYEERGLSFDSVMDPDNLLAEKFLVDEIPTTFVFHKGKLILHKNKEFDFMSEDFLSTIKELLSEPQL